MRQMHKLLIVSDSHSLTTELTDIYERHDDVDAALHCGDSELDTYSPYLKNYTVVKGNCDIFSAFSEEEVVQLGGLNILLTHGHLFRVKENLMTIQYAAREKEADVILFGHTHVALAKQEANQLFINPGSIHLPKQYPEPTYAVMSWSDKTNITVTFYETYGKEVQSFRAQNQFNLK